MEAKIQTYLTRLEAERDVKVLLACETGSRAWGFPSPDSDYDVRLLYVHRNDWYVAVNEPKDTIDVMLENNDLDISGWELRKSLRLLQKSNAALLERIQSPIIYRADEAFLNDFKTLADRAYSRIATIHHYLSMAKKTQREVTEGADFKLKKFFYALRSATVCKWIVERETMPPMEFAAVYRQLDLSPQLIRRIEELTALKATKSEAYRHADEPLLLDFIQQCIELAEWHKNNLPSGKCATEDLNRFLRKHVQ